VPATEPDVVVLDVPPPVVAPLLVDEVGVALRLSAAGALPLKK